MASRRPRRARGSAAVVTLTPEQEAANRTLEQALDQVAQAFEIEGVRTGYLVSTHHVFYDEGEECSSLAWHAPEGQQWMTTLGMHTTLGMRLRTQYLGTDDDPTGEP